MPVPDFQTIMLPFMKPLADGEEWKMRDVVESLASGFSLTDDERQEMLPSSHSKVFNNLVGLAKTHLKNAVLVIIPNRVTRSSPFPDQLEKLDGQYCNLAALRDAVLLKLIPSELLIPSVERIVARAIWPTINH